MRNTKSRINLDFESSSGQDKYISHPINALTTVSEIPEYGAGKKSPRSIKIAIRPGTKNLGKPWIRNKAGALRSVIRLRNAECVTTGTAGFGFFGLFAWPISQLQHGFTEILRRLIDNDSH
jgi:hypothetical protein